MPDYALGSLPQTCVALRQLSELTFLSVNICLVAFQITSLLGQFGSLAFPFG